MANIEYKQAEVVDAYTEEEYPVLIGKMKKQQAEIPKHEITVEVKKPVEGKIFHV